MNMYDAEYTKTFFDAYGSFEWDRLEATGYGRLQAAMHTEFISRYVKQGDRVLDAGCGPGRFTIIFAELRASVTALDLSERQLQLAEDSVQEAGLLDRLESFVSADITDLSSFPDGCFDVVICYGGALSYVCEQRHRAASELVRVVRPGGTLLVSVMSRYGALTSLVRGSRERELRDPETWLVWQVAEDGDLYGILSRRMNIVHPAMHMYTSDELQDLLPHCEVLEIAGSNVTTFEGSHSLDELPDDPQIWSTVVRLERELSTSPGLVDSGSHIIMAARKTDC